MRRALFLWLALAGCEADLHRAPDVDARGVRERFTLTVDAAHPGLTRETLDPVEGPVAVRGEEGVERLSMRVFAKPAARREGWLWLDVYVQNESRVGLRDVSIAIEGEARDWTRDPFVTETTERVALAGIAPEGVGRFSLGVPRRAGSLSLEVTATDTSRVSTRSGPLAITPDGAEVWASFPDGDVVVVLDASSGTRRASLAVPGRPSSVAISDDGRFVLVAAPSANTVTVIDRAARRVVARFGEADGVGREPRHVVFSPDGSRAFVSAYVGDRITSLARRGDTFTVEGTAQVGRRPAGLSVSPDSATVLVSHFLPRGPVTDNEGWITVLDAAPLAVAREVAVHDHFNVDAAHCIADVFGVRPERMTTEGVPTQLAGVFLDPAGNEGWTPGTRAAGAAVVWEAGEGGRERFDTLVAIRPGELVPPFVFLFDTRDARETERLGLPSALERPVSEDYTACARYQLELEFVAHDTIPRESGSSAPDARVNRFLAFPAGVSGLSESGIIRHVGFTRGGRRALLVSGVADEIIVHDAMTHHPSSRAHFLLSGHNPNGVVVSPDGSRAWVSYDNSPFVSVLDLGAYADPDALPEPRYVPYAFRAVPDVPQTGVAFMDQLLVREVGEVPEHPAIEEIAQIPLVDEDPMDPELRRGAILFGSANPERHPRLSQSRNGACASCHPGGGHDGTMWGTMEGERRTMSLRGGVAGRGWLHASGTHRDIREFVDVVVAERLGGELREDELDALARYVAHGIPRLQPPVVDAALAARGGRLFEDYCSECHAGEERTSGNPDPSSPWGGGLDSPELHDVGTASDDARVVLGTFFESLLSAEEAELLSALRGDRDLGGEDPVQSMLGFRPRPARARGMLKAPSLTNAWDGVVFFHDGRFTELSDAVHYLNISQGLALGADDERALVEFLRTL